MYNNIFYENDTNEVKGSYHDEYLEKRRKKKHILHIELGHGGQQLQKYVFCKMPRERTSEEKNFNV